MSEKKVPFDKELLYKISQREGTPFYIYDGKAIVNNFERFKKAFSWNSDFRNYFAVKALPNLNILKMLGERGSGSDCSSLPELKLSKEAGITGERIMFTSNDTPNEEFIEAYRLNAIINLDDITHINALESAIKGFPETISFRYNPGKERTGNVFIGNPVEAKYGVTKDQLFDCYKIAKQKGVKHFYLHTMVASCELKRDFIVQTANSLFSLVKKIYDETGIRIEGVDLGGGIGIPYTPDAEEMNLELLSKEIKELYDSIIVKNGLAPLKVFFECGRMITGPYGYLVTKVRHVCHKYKDYVGLDACMADLMRPALYGAYHHITVLGKENEIKDHKYDVTGSLCENNDKFAIDRPLCKVEKGDMLVIHDAGAHAHAMGFNYNAKLRSPEFLVNPNGDILKIRRRETFADYVAPQLFNPEKLEF